MFSLALEELRLYNYSNNCSGINKHRKGLASECKHKMSLDFQSIREQVKQMGETAVVRQRELRDKWELARKLLEGEAQDLSALRQKVQDVAQNYDPTLRCALPIDDSLTEGYPLPALPTEVTILAADGSQITPDRNAGVNYALINVGAIQMSLGSSLAPSTTTISELLYDEDLYTSTGTITDARLALMRDLKERAILAKLAEQIPPPLVTFTDGPMELWIGMPGGGRENTETKDILDAYIEALNKLHSLDVATAGYVDRPGANLIVRTLEVAIADLSKIADMRDFRPLRGVTDVALYGQILKEGERSPVFALQSQSAKSYQGLLALHFFYLNVGRTGHPYLARVEIPAWVAENEAMLDNLHATLVDQAKMMGARPYPYLLQRAHETALVKLQEKEQVTQMISLELRKQGIEVEQVSAKQFAKQSEGRMRYEG